MPFQEIGKIVEISSFGVKRTYRYEIPEFVVVPFSVVLSRSAAQPLAQISTPFNVANTREF
jgi:hypothetical protein